MLGLRYYSTLSCWQVIGLDTTVQFSDKEKLPYVTATINEVQRISTLGTTQYTLAYILIESFVIKTLLHPMFYEFRFYITN